jgi:hypothetical protein
MRLDPSDNVSDARLSFVFSDAVMLFDLSANATFEDIALKLGDAALSGRGPPVAILVAWGTPPSPPR